MRKSFTWSHQRGDGIARRVACDAQGFISSGVKVLAAPPRGRLAAGAPENSLDADEHQQQRLSGSATT